MTAELHFAPLLTGFWLELAAAVALAGAVLALASRRKFAALWRVFAFAALFLAVLDPAFVRKESKPLSDIAVIAVDRSASQEFGQRPARTAAVLENLKRRLGEIDGLTVETVDVATTRRGDEGEGTYLFDALRAAQSRIPADRAAGVILLTDGQVHDAGLIEGLGPVSAIMTGDRDEKDRAVLLEGTPSYGVVGKDVTFSLKVSQTGLGTGPVALTVTRDGQVVDQRLVAPDTPVSLDYPLPHGGANYFEFSAEVDAGELTSVNNRAVASVNGVRDRLKVLLVSGRPYPGERTWRNLLKSDAAVDLVHFTILRSPDRMDPTPGSELSLIAFPVDELFSEKIRDFDLIIFDRYEFRDVLLPVYLSNIADYVREGGALLMAGAPDYVSKNALYQTELRDVLPARPIGDELIERAFMPELTAEGKNHPVTSVLAHEPLWGRWFRQARVIAGKGTVLMSGVEGLPLLVLARMGEGRVAQLTSDDIWFWSRGIEGGGPHGVFLRRLVHWLMKEPELDENAIKAVIEDRTLSVQRPGMADAAASVQVETPAGEVLTLNLTPQPGLGLAGQMSATEKGIYKISNGSTTVFVTQGDLSSPEFSDIRATAEKIAPAVETSGGKVLWSSDVADPAVRLQDARKTSYGGRDWIGLRRNHAEQVTGAVFSPLLPAWAWLGFLLAAVVGLWIFEGQAAKSVRR